MIKITFPKKSSVVEVRLTEEKTNSYDGKELCIGVGKKSDLNIRKRMKLTRKVLLTAKQYGIKKFAINFEDFGISGEVLATNLEIANYEFNNYKTLPSDKVSVESIEILGASNRNQEEISRGQIIGEEMNNCRNLANMPGGDMTPLLLAEKAKEAVRGTSVRVKILDRDDMKILKMGAVLGVAQGSVEPPAFIVMEYFGAKDKKEKPVVLVGKGITFDSGGLNIKPDNHMNDMHLDMSGGAVVIHSIVTASKLKLKKNIVALVPAVENMPSGSSYRPGDILRSMSGQSIEVGNTDAEGRVVLADALTYAEKYNPQIVVDVATLTGAAEVALGQRASAIFGKDEKIIEKFMTWGEETGDYVWPLPLWDEYEEEIKGNFGDWANIGKVRWGGAIHGAIFLYQFAKKYPWVHIDMAPRMISAEGDNLAKGSTGEPLRLLVRALESL